MIRFIHTSGEAFDGDWCEVPCDECGLMRCDCGEEYLAAAERLQCACCESNLDEQGWCASCEESGMVAPLDERHLGKGWNRWAA